MAVKDGSLINIELTKIMKTKNPTIDNRSYTLLLHTEAADIPITLIHSIDVLRDYSVNLTDYIVPNFTVSAGIYFKKIQPYKDNLELSIITTVGEVRYMDKYKFIITNNNNNVYGSDYTSSTTSELDNDAMITIEGQCLFREVEGLRTVLVDGVYRNTDVGKMMTAVFTKNAPTASVEGKAVSVLFDVYTPDNDKTYEHINVPTGTYLLDLPTALQNGQYGVYNGAVGTYLQKYNNVLTVFIYPLYNADRYAIAGKKLIIYYSNHSSLEFIENTYSVNDGVVKIIANTKTVSMDTGENDIISSGDSIVSVDSDKLMNRNAVVTNDKISTSKETQMMGVKVKDKRDGVNKDNYVGMDANNFSRRSLINRKNMALYQVTWNYADIELLYPGMPVSYVYEDIDNGVVQLTGAVQSVYSRYNKNTGTTSALINILVIKPSVYLNL